MNRPRYVAVGLLTEGDLQRLGEGFRAVYPITQTTDFDDLLKSLDRVSGSDRLPPESKN